MKTPAEKQLRDLIYSIELGFKAIQELCENAANDPETWNKIAKVLNGIEVAKNRAARYGLGHVNGTPRKARG